MDQLAEAPVAPEANEAGAADTTTTTTTTTDQNLQDQLYPDEGQGDQQTGQEGEQGAEGDGEDGEQQPPAIEPPHSWNAEDRAKWDAVPPDVKETILRRETERDSIVRQKSAEAQQARQATEREAAQAVLQVKQAHIAQLDALMGPLPQAPDPRLLQTGQEEHRALFYQQEAEFRLAVDQRQQVHQQAEQARQQAAQLEHHANATMWQQYEPTLAEKLGTEWTDPAQRPNLLATLEPIGTALGYSAEQMRDANPVDILALKEAHTWKAKAEKWDSLQKAKMTPVRAAKFAPKVTQPGVAGGGQSGNGQTPVQNILYPNDVRK